MTHLERTSYRKIDLILKYISNRTRWNVDNIFEKNILANVKILLALINHFKPDGKILLLLPKKLDVSVIEKQKRQDGSINTKKNKISLSRYVSKSYIN